MTIPRKVPFRQQQSRELCLYISFCFYTMLRVIRYFCNLGLLQFRTFYTNVNNLCLKIIDKLAVFASSWLKRACCCCCYRGLFERQNVMAEARMDIWWLSILLEYSISLITHSHIQTRARARSHTHNER